MSKWHPPELLRFRESVNGEHGSYTDITKNWFCMVCGEWGPLKDQLWFDYLSYSGDTIFKYAGWMEPPFYGLVFGVCPACIKELEA